MTNTLRVLPNPFFAHDHYGRPCGAFPYEPNLVTGDPYVRYVGATRTVTNLRDANPNLRQTQLDDHAWTFDTDTVVSIENTDYYRRAVRTGELLAADLKTWRAAGCDPRNFVEPKTALERSQAGMMLSLIRHYGEDGPAELPEKLKTKAAEPMKANASSPVVPTKKPAAGAP